MKRFFYFGSVLLLSILSSASAQSVFSSAELNSALQRSGLAKQRLYSLQTFDADDGTTMLAALSGSQEGWHVSVFHLRAGRLQREWYSHRLTPDFDVSSPHNLAIEDAGGEHVVLFSGCARHMCGGDRHGFLLYSPTTREAFYAHLENINEKTGREVKFSQNAMEQRNEKYKQVLQRGIDDIVRRTEIK